MSKDFSSDQGGTQKAADTEFDKQEFGTPTTGFTAAPKSEDRRGAPGPGVGNSRPGIR